jgi:hypothetical protein
MASWIITCLILSVDFCNIYLIFFTQKSKRQHYDLVCSFELFKKLADASCLGVDFCNIYLVFKKI